MSRGDIDIKSPSRRDFLGISLAATNGLIIDFSFGGRGWGQEVPATPPASASKSKPNAFVRINTSGLITLVLPYV